MGIYLHWTEKELKYLSLNYYGTPGETLRSNLRNRDLGAINRKASVLGLHKASTRLSKASNLLSQTPEAYYWLGFLLADGGFTERRIGLKIADKDADHLQCFHNFIESKNKIRRKDNTCQVRVTDIATVTELRKRFDITNCKTYHPCKIDQIGNDDLLFALIIGFIDGDGCVTKNKSRKSSFILSVVGHHSWLSNFMFMEDNLRRIVGSEPQRSAKIRDHYVMLPKQTEKRKFRLADFYICDRETLLAIRKKADDLHLPFMARKLGKIE